MTSIAKIDRELGHEEVGIAEGLAIQYMDAKEAVIEAGYAWEIDWQETARYKNVTESSFLREAAWVILSGGMREKVIRDKFPHISQAFFEWKSAEKITRNRRRCFDDAMSYFGHRGKINAIIEVAKRVAKLGLHVICKAIEDDPISYISTFPYMGPATSYHFAKNLGIPVAKPDRHLRRIAQSVGYSSPQALCADIASATGECISVVDIILWRFATLEKDYLSQFSSVC